MSFVTRLRCVAAVWTGSSVFEPISGPRWLLGRRSNVPLRISSIPVMPFPSPRSIGCPRSSRRAPSVGLARRFCRIPPFSPRMRSSRPFVSSILPLRLRIRVSMGSLRRVAPQAAPSADTEQVCKALFSFPSTSDAGCSGLRPSHVRDALRPASSDLLLRFLSEVVSILLRGEVPEEVRPRLGTSLSLLCSAPPTFLRLLRRLLMFFHEVESRKCACQGTAAAVAERGATFVPLVLEACGGEGEGGGRRGAAGGGRGWSQAFRAVVAWIASESRTARGLATDLPRDTSLWIAQRISCTLHWENARAILRRSPGSVHW